MQVKQNEKSIAVLLEISDNEEGMKEVENKGLSLPLHRDTQDVQASLWRAKRAGDEIFL
jgi:hypothetical protein